MSPLIDWLFVGVMTMLGSILLYPVSKEIGKSFRSLFNDEEVLE